MATCKDCIHHKACSADRKNDNYFMLIGCVNVETNCIDFVGKSHFVEVVRCKDCKHYAANTMWCAMNSRPMSASYPNWYADDFCSYGERRTDNG